MIIRNPNSLGGGAAIKSVRAAPTPIHTTTTNAPTAEPIKTPIETVAIEPNITPTVAVEPVVPTIVPPELPLKPPPGSDTTLAIGKSWANGVVVDYSSDGLSVKQEANKPSEALKLNKTVSLHIGGEHGLLVTIVPLGAESVSNETQTPTTTTQGEQTVATPLDELNKTESEVDRG